MHVYVLPMQAAPDKEKTGQKTKHQNRQGEKKEQRSFPPMALAALLPGRPQRKESVHSESKSPQGTGLPELFLNVAK